MKKHCYGLAIVGFGGMGSQHARTLEPVEEIRLIGTYDILAARQLAARELGYETFDSFEHLLEDVRVDIVLIATPNHLHKELSILAMEAGKHVICEKPVTLNADELLQIIAVSERTGQLFSIHQNRRWDEDFRMVKKVYEEGQIGKIWSIESRVMGSQGIPGDWRTKKEFGGGMLLDWGIHLADQLLWLLPEQITKVYCKLGYLLGGECDDNVKLYLSFESGIEALVEVGAWNMESLPRWYVNGMDGTMTVRDFWFKKGSITRLTADVKNNTKPINAGKGITKTMAPRHMDTVEMMELPRVTTDVRDYYRNFTKAISGTEALIVTPEQALRVMRLMDIARLSARQDQVLPFETEAD